MSDNSKKLAIKSELLRHLNTATEMERNGEMSSGLKVMSLKFDIALLEKRGLEPDVEFWDRWLGEDNSPIPMLAKLFHI